MTATHRIIRTYADSYPTEEAGTTEITDVIVVEADTNSVRFMVPGDWRPFVYTKSLGVRDGFATMVVAL